MQLLINSHDFHKIFTELDKNGDGYVSLEDLTSFLGKLDIHIGCKELESIVGVKGFGLEEFVLFCEGVYGEKEEQESDVVEAFKVFDLNNDGFISCDEIEYVLGRLGLWEGRSVWDCRKMICEFDVNLDGKLDFEEFKKMMLMT